MTALRSIAFGLLMLASISLSAGADKPADTRLDQALQMSGLLASFDDIAPILIEDVIANRRRCGESGEQVQALATRIGEAYAPRKLTAVATATMRRRIDDSILDAALAWYGSSAGQAIVAAEKSIGLMNPEELIQREQALSESPRWDAERQKTIRQLLVATKTHQFVASLYLAQTAAVTSLKACKQHSLSLELTQAAIDDVVDDRVLIGFMLMGELMLPTGVTFVDVPPATLDEYLAFASSSDGLKWHQALVDTLGETLAGQIGEIAELDADKLAVTEMESR